MSCNQKVVMTVEIGENGQVVSIKGAEGTKVQVFDEGCAPDMPVGTITKFVPLTAFCAHNSPQCWYFFDGRWYKIC